MKRPALTLVVTLACCIIIIGEAAPRLAAGGPPSAAFEPATPTITWPGSFFIGGYASYRVAAEPLQAGTILGPNELNATANVPGTFEYSLFPQSPVPAGLTIDSALPVGCYLLYVHFTPTDTVHYTTADDGRRLLVGDFSESSHPKLEPFTFPFAWGTAVDPAHNRVYAAAWDGVSERQGLYIFDGTTHDVVASRLTDSPFSPWNMVVDVERRQLIVTGQSADVRIYEADTLDPIDVIVTPAAQELTLNAADGLVFVRRLGSASEILMIDLTRPIGDPQRLRTISVSGVRSVVANPRTGYLHVVRDVPSFRLDVIDGNPGRPSFGQTLATSWLEAQGGVYFNPGLAVDRVRNEVLVPNTPVQIGDVLPPTSILVYDADPARPTFNQVVATIPIAAQSDTQAPGEYRSVNHIAVDATNHRAYASVSNGNYAGAVIAIDTETRAVLSKSMLLADLFVYADGGTRVTINPVTGRIYAPFITAAPLHVLQERVTHALSIPTDFAIAPVTVQLTGVGVTFSDVTLGGETSVSFINAANANLQAPGQFDLNGALAYEVTTTAAITGPIGLCFSPGIDDPDAFAALRVLHGENGQWIDRTASHDFSTGRICATVSSLSPFAIARKNATYQTQVLFDTSRAFKAGSTVPIKLRLFDPATGANVSSALVTLIQKRLTQLSSAATWAIQDSGNANPDGTFRYDASLNGYVFNLSTKGLAAGTYELTFRAAGDAVLRTVQFQIR